MSAREGKKVPPEVDGKILPLARVTAGGPTMAESWPRIRCDDCFLLTAREAERRGVLVSAVAPILCATHLTRIQAHAADLSGTTYAGGEQP